MPIAGSPVGFPTLVIEVAFSTDPLSGAPIWTDISAYNRGLTTKRGRNRELDRFSAGTASLRLRNLDRRFEPEYAGSPYYPNVIPARRIRVSAVYGSDRFALYTGFVDGWDPSWPTIGDAEVPISASDILEFLNVTNIESSIYRSTVMADAPSVYYRFDDNEWSGQVASETGTGAGYYSTGVVRGALGALVADVSSAVTFKTSADNIQLPSIVSGVAAFSLEMWVQTRSTSSPLLFRQTQSTPPGSNTLVVYLGNDGSLNAGFEDSGGSFWTAGVGGGTLLDGNWHHIVVTRASDGKTVTFFADGVQLAQVVAPSALSLGSGLVYIGAGVNDTSHSTSIDEFAAYPVALSAAQVAAHYHAGSSGWGQHYGGARVNAVLDNVGVAAGDRNVDSGQSLLQAVTGTLTQTTALSHLQAVETSEQGHLFASADGKVTFRDRYHYLFAPYTVSQLTISDVDPSTGLLPPGALPYVTGSLKATYDKTELWNRITAQRTGGALQVAEDAGSEATYGVRVPPSQDTGLLNATDLDVWDRANYKLSRYKEPFLRIEAVTLDGRADQRLWPHLLGREIGDLVTVMRHPPGGGTGISKLCRIEGISHKIDPKTRTWTTTWNLSPADIRQYAICDDPVLGLCDSAVAAF